MNVPPFVPQPIEIQNNVGEEPYLVRLRFIKRVAGLHWISIGVIALLAALYPGNLGVAASATTSLLLLVALTLIRFLVKGRPMEQRVSAALIPPLLIAIGMLCRDLIHVGWPLWALGLPPTFGLAYALLCGRDLSFIGMFLAGWVGSWIAIPVILFAFKLPIIDLGPAMGLALAYGFYCVYDLAALQSRRRLGEEVGALADLYRDMLNFMGYGVRVWLHWKKHRIWSAR